MRKKRNFKVNRLFARVLYSTALIFSAGLFFSNHQAYAEDAVCSDSPGWAMDTSMQCSFLGIEGDGGLTSTTKATALWSTMTVSDQLYNQNPDIVGMCAAANTADIAANHKTNGKPDPLPRPCGDEFTLMSCKDLDKALKDRIEYGGGNEDAGREKCNANSRYSSFSGSILGIARLAYDTTVKGDLPIDLRYYAQRNLQKIPLINQTAFAAEVSYPGLGLSLALTLWETSRDFAYAIMSIVMLVLGIMIIMRKSISPQVVVTVQNALPRVIISLFLITFSYPIGALMASAIRWLIGLIIMLFISTSLGDNFSGFDLNIVAVFQLLSSLFSGSGISAAISGLIFSVMVVAALLAALFKAMLVYLKIVIMIVFAPIQFAWGAIPGQEHVIIDWFKKMGALVLAIPAIMFYVMLGWYVYTQPFVNMGQLYTGAGGSFIEQGYTMFILPILVTMIMLQSVTADKKINEAFGIDAKKKR